MANMRNLEAEMTNVKMTVGGAMEKEAALRFIDAWHRAENGETFRERHLAFESGTRLPAY
jgi:hypothetical protein